MNNFIQIVWDHRAIASKIVIAIFLGGMMFQRIPSSGDIEKINSNLVKILNDQRQRIDQHDVALASRITRDDVSKMISGPDNPWMLQSSVVMTMVSRYPDDRDRVRDEISNLWRALGARRKGSK